ncbi:uncharacterized protein V1510DRAFT_416454 [Dipodascopsis tothii]|uniref:uncharacterized protein n=1 Tax=Dipodascopsis tothii TaxID=44089 RepID=UPI0034CD1B97
MSVVSSPSTAVSRGTHGSNIPVPVSSTTSVSQSAMSDSPGSLLSDSRKRQNKRDEAIRRKIESDLSKKRNTPARSRQVKRPPPGTVLALRPSPALQIKPNTTVAEAAQLMSARRENCVLVTDEDDRIAGIFTAKDLAFRVVGSGIDPRDITIDQIMTKNPLCARTDTSATDALDLMVRKGFRHLPVMDENQDISGILDITKCFHEAMEKLERAYVSSRKLFDALEGVQSELGASQPAQIIQYVEALRSKMAGPSLESVLDGQSPTFVNIRTSVRDAAALMKENHTTAVLVTDKNAISGIFTSKDVVLRVIAAGLDPSKCSVVRVMTPHPDFAPKDMSIQAALRKMHDGHYLNLPVMGDDSEIVGMVDVLKLTYATLEQINSMQTSESEGPAWNKFWMSFDDTESVHSDHVTMRSATPFSDTAAPSILSPETSHAEAFYSQDLGPADSASHFAEDSVMPSIVSPVGSLPFTFKFKTPGGKVHRIHAAATDGYMALRGLVQDKLGPETDALGGPGRFVDGQAVAAGFAISYRDDEGDIILITSDDDLLESVQLAQRSKMDKVDLFVHHPDQPAYVPPPPPAPATPTPKKARDDDDESDATPTPAGRKGHPMYYPPPPAAPKEEIIPGVPNELLLPGAMVTLAATIIGVFIVSRIIK